MCQFNVASYTFMYLTNFTYTQSLGMNLTALLMKITSVSQGVLLPCVENKVDYTHWYHKQPNQILLATHHAASLSPTLIVFMS